MKEVVCDEERNCFVDMDNSNKDLPDDLLPLKTLKTERKKRVRRVIKGKGRSKRTSFKKPLSGGRRKRKRSKNTKKKSGKKGKRIKRKR